MKIIGVAFTFGDEDQNICYFVSLVDDIKKHAEINDTIAPDSQDPSITIDERYGNIGCEVSSLGEPNWVDFWLKMNIKQVQRKSLYLLKCNKGKT